MSLSTANLQMLEQAARPADGVFESEPGQIETLLSLLPACWKGNDQRLAYKIQHLAKRVLNELHDTAPCSYGHALGNSANSSLKEAVCGAAMQ